MAARQRYPQSTLVLCGKVEPLLGVKKTLRFCLFCVFDPEIQRAVVFSLLTFDCGHTRLPLLPPTTRLLVRLLAWRFPRGWHALTSGEKFSPDALPSTNIQRTEFRKSPWERYQLSAVSRRKYTDRKRHGRHGHASNVPNSERHRRNVTSSCLSFDKHALKDKMLSSPSPSRQSTTGSLLFVLQGSAAA